MHSKKPLRPIYATTILLIALAAAFTPAAAQDKRLSIAVIDIQSVLRDSKAAKSVRPQIEKLRKRYQNAVRKRESELRKASQGLQRQRAILSPDAFAKKRREYETKARGAQTEFQTRKRQLDGAYSVAIGKVQKSMLLAAAKIASERKLDLILPKSIIILSAKSLDITKEVLRRVDKNLPSVKVTMPKPNPARGSKAKN
jgi:Skp family chaperone for outer membrane proteins